jgi:hypothetical protein
MRARAMSRIKRGKKGFSEAVKARDRGSTVGPLEMDTVPRG